MNPSFKHRIKSNTDSEETFSESVILCFYAENMQFPLTKNAKLVIIK